MEMDLVFEKLELYILITLTMQIQILNFIIYQNLILR